MGVYLTEASQGEPVRKFTILEFMGPFQHTFPTSHKSLKDDLQGCLRWGRTGSCPSVLLREGGRGAKIARRNEPFPSFLYSKGAFSGVIDILVQEQHFLGQPVDPQLYMV